ncbi:hypothetical protein PCC8801_1163 [Rippkaea orientalis PCC 8801]|uniref:Uncharacterized protein n=1 Tax=Rippkaea orientalis (strain PCC 8801 / RF-1) TaxID=41431 RepID=B7K295_RIPO1|nr:hypothetical protein [Rippkaea orientalis]ACK65231.1 hypothetical protein PCC8801_1163 [Rippkaea orientalis PCC 8801]
MNYCPICSGKILRHINQNEIYWYCPCCHETVPNLNQISARQNNSSLPLQKESIAISIKVTA